MKQISANAKQFVREKYTILAIASELIRFYNDLDND
jgi:hypothetical protein